jgi:hypothetical protein
MPPSSDIQIISAIFHGEVITAGFGKIYFSQHTGARVSSYARRWYVAYAFPLTYP